jgi:hypothetical protein
MQEQIMFSQTQQFRQFVEDLARLESASGLIHGIFIDVHPAYAALADIQRRTGFSHGAGPFLSAPFGLGDNDEFAGGVYDYDDLPEAWQGLCKSHAKSPTPPFIVKVYITPTTPEMLPLRRLIQNVALQAPFFVSVQERPVAVMSASLEGGLDISATSSGTLGGFLEDAGGTRWGVTCGHVAQTTGSFTITDAGGTTFTHAGAVRHTNFGKLVKTTQASFCNPFGNAHPEVDAALVELDPSHAARNTIYSGLKVDSIYAHTQLGSGCTVWVRGAASSSNNYVVRGYGVTLQVRFSQTSNDYYCFSKLFELSAPRRGGLMQGDSGAWVLYNHTGTLYGYYGNVFAVSGSNAYATFADATQTWAKADHGLDLTPF